MDGTIIEILDDFVDLDAEKTADDFISEWDVKCRKKLSICSVADNENVLGDLMKDYFESLKEMVIDYGDNDFLKRLVFCHMSFLYQYYIELKCYTPDSYLCSMEDILSIYCNVHLQLIRSIKKNKELSKKNYKKKIMAVGHHLIRTLTVYLLDRSDHILHVLIKMNTKNLSESGSDLLNVLYKHFLINVPAFNRCDESFCRSYIVFQKWKEIKKSDEWEQMDRIMYQLFRRTPGSVKNNETLKKILTPVYLSTVDVVLNLIRPFQEIINAYFKHINSKKSSDLGDFDFNLDLVGENDDDTITPIEGESDEEVQFMQLYYEFEKNMSSLPHSAIESLTSEIDIVTLKEEIDDELYSTIQDSSSSEAAESMHNAENHTMTTDQYEDSYPHLPSGLGVSQICIGSVTTVDETLNANAVESVLQDQIFSSVAPDSNTNTLLNTDMELEITQPNKILCSEDLDSNKSSLPITQVVRRHVEVQAVEYGITTPPFDEMSLEHTGGPVRLCLYTNIGQDQKEYVNRRSVEVQVDSPTVFNDCGLTPPNDVNIEDHGAHIQQKCLYTDIRKNQNKKNNEDLLPSSKTDCEDNARDNDSCDNFLDSNSDTETTQVPFDNLGEVEHSPCFEKEVINFDALSTEGESKKNTEPRTVLQEKTAICSPQLEKEPYSNTESNDHIDTGQTLVINPAPNIETRKEELAPSTDICNGGKVVKPLQLTKTDNVSLPPYKGKIIFTSTSRLTAPLETFSKFEIGSFKKMKDAQDLDDILSGPLTKLTPDKNHSLNSREKFDLLGPEITTKNLGSGNSRSSSPVEMTSPPYERIDDFKNHYSDCVNGKVSPGRDLRVPQGILKKGGSSRRKNDRIMFDETVRYKSEEKSRLSRIKVPKSVNRDKRFKQTLNVELDRLGFVENELKNELKKRQTIQVIYDKTTNHINDNDVVRCVSPPKLTWNLSRVMPNKGSLGVKNWKHLEKKPKKRKNEIESNNDTNELAISGEKIFRMSKTLSGRKRKAATSSDNFSVKSDKFENLLSSGAYSSKPFRLDLSSS